jgi:hypothetical protein
MVLEGYERTRVLLRENVLGVTNKGEGFFEDQKSCAIRDIILAYLWLCNATSI